MSTEAIHVVDFLKANPEFLVDNPGVLACVELPARTTGKKVSYLQDRQLLSMREKVKTLERRIANLTIAAVENQAIVQKLMALTQVLLPITDETQLTHTLLGHLRTQFAIPMVGLQLWSASLADNDNEQDKDKQSIERMKDLYCGFAEHAPSLSVFQAEPQQPRSVVIIPLRFAGQTNTSGVLGFGSADKDRFAPTLEVDFLRTLFEIVCAALSRLQKTNS